MTVKGIVIGINLTFGYSQCKTKGSCVYNKTEGKIGSFSSFIAFDITCKLMRLPFIGKVGCVVSIIMNFSLWTLIVSCISH